MRSLCIKRWMIGPEVEPMSVSLYVSMYMICMHRAAASYEWDGNAVHVLIGAEDA